MDITKRIFNTIHLANELRLCGIYTDTYFSLCILDKLNNYIQNTNNINITENKDITSLKSMYTVYEYTS